MGEKNTFLELSSPSFFRRVKAKVPFASDRASMTASLKRHVRLFCYEESTSSASPQYLSENPVPFCVFVSRELKLKRTVPLKFSSGKNSRRPSRKGSRQEGDGDPSPSAGTLSRLLDLLPGQGRGGTSSSCSWGVQGGRPQIQHFSTLSTVN